MLSNVNLDLMRTLLKTSQAIRLKKVKDLRTIIEEKINDDGGKIQNFSDFVLLLFYSHIFLKEMHKFGGFYQNHIILQVLDF